MNFKIGELIQKIKSSNTYEILRHSRNYLSADLAVKAIGFISIPIFTRLLTEEEYGIISTFYAYVPIILVLLSLNTYNSVGRYYYEKKEDLPNFLGSYIILLTLIVLFTSTFYFAFHGIFFPLIKMPYPLPILIVFVCIFNIVYSIYLQTLYPQRKSKRVAFVSIVYGYTTLFMAIIFTIILKNNKYLGRIFASIIVGLLSSIYFISYLRKNLKFSFNKNHVKYILAYSIPLIPYSLSEQILSQFDRIMINSAIGAQPVGFYSIGYNIGMLLLLIISSVYLSFTPDFFRLIDEKNHLRLNTIAKRMFSIILIFGFLLILFGENILVFLADPKFYPGKSVIMPVVIGYIFYGMFIYYSIYVNYSKKMILLAYSTLISGILNIILNSIFIPKYGYIGAAYTTTISYFTLFLLVWLMIKIKIDLIITPLKYLWDNTLILLFLLTIEIIIIDIVEDPTLIFLIKILFFIIFAIMAFWKDIYGHVFQNISS